MSEDMSNIINQLNNMIQNNEIPSDIRNMMNNFANSNNNSANNDIQDMSSNSEDNTSTEFDINTIMKMKKIMDSMKSSKDDPRANLLKSLKPYLKESRKEKVDQYISLFNMGKVFEMLRSIGW